MRALPLLVAALGFGAALAPNGMEEPRVLLLGGDTDGYLSPCGCTKPMAGGIRRRADAIRVLAIPGRTLVLDNGSLVSGAGRQDQLKAETQAELNGKLGIWTQFGTNDSVLGRGYAQSLQALSQNRFFTTSLEESASNPFPTWVAAKPFLVGAVSMRWEALGQRLGIAAVSPDTAVQRLTAEAEAQGLVPVLLLQGTYDEAQALARRHPALRLIQYRSTGDPPPSATRIGDTLLVTVGEKGKHLVRLEYASGQFGAYLPVKLNPEFADEPDAQRLYRTYLARVGEENLLDRLPRRDTPGFAGTKACAGCHQEAMKVWQHSEHAGALKTLEDDGHDRDPDCVGCHVVGLESKVGFRSREKTPDFADVGCESCHGPGLAHSLDPYKNKLPKVGERSCMSCHVPEHSPGFNFAEYWERIKHE